MKNLFLFTNATNFHAKTHKGSECRVSTRTRGLGLVTTSCTKLHMHRSDSKFLKTHQVDYNYKKKKDLQNHKLGEAYSLGSYTLHR